MKAKTDPNYYNSGSTELAVETALTLKKLEKRRRLTKNSRCLVIVLVGLPARGKSFVARKLKNFLTWNGNHCRIFNVGKYRRDAYAASQNNTPRAADENINENNFKRSESEQRLKMGCCDANFFDSGNAQASNLRQQVAEAALRDMLSWLDGDDNIEFAANNFELDASSDVADVECSRHSLSSVSTLGTSVTRAAAERVAIFDATNSTAKRRQWILEECTSPEKRKGKQPTGVVFVESVCDDVELLEENFRFKINNSPDFKGMSQAEAMADLRQRVEKYEAAYETIEDDSLSYIKIFNLSTKILVNHIYGRMSKMIVPALMAWHIGTRPVYLCRPGQTILGIEREKAEQSGSPQSIDDTVETASNSSGSVGVTGGAVQQQYLLPSQINASKNRRDNRLGPSGKKFSDALFNFCALEGNAFLEKRASIMDNKLTGTSISGMDNRAYIPRPLSSSELSKLASTSHHHSNVTDGNDAAHLMHDDEDNNGTPFPLRILVSTMPRSYETVAWEDYEIRMEMLSSLNPLDKGDFSGMELEDIRDKHPEWYSTLEMDPFHTRFPGGESYSDLIARLNPVIIDLEQQVIPTLVVSHVSVLQTLIAYFRNTPIERCVNIEVPMHTVLKFDPVRGGGWKESQFSLSDLDMHMFTAGAATVAATNATTTTTTASTTSTVDYDSNVGGVSSNSSSSKNNNIDVNVVSEAGSVDSSSSNGFGGAASATPIWGDHLIPTNIDSGGSDFQDRHHRRYLSGVDVSL